MIFRSLSVNMHLSQYSKFIPSIKAKEIDSWTAKRKSISRNVPVPMTPALEKESVANACPITFDPESFRAAVSRKRPKRLLIGLLRISPGLSSLEKCSATIRYARSANPETQTKAMRHCFQANSSVLPHCTQSSPYRMPHYRPSP